MEAAWKHSEALGLKPEDYITMDCAMVARRHELNYLVPTFEGDQLIVCTWIINNDGKYTSRREYQIFRKKDNKTVFRGATDWVCIRLNDGKLYPMPKEFIEAYQPTNM
jgi:acyl-CoA thioester hydrolase